MSLVTICPSKINGMLNAPSSKSYSQRACAAALLKGGKSIITNYGNSNDELIAIEIIKQLGAIVEIKDNKLFINSLFNNKKNNCTNLFAGESGLSLRLFTPIASLLSNEISITASGSLLNRPIDFFDKIFAELNVEYKSSNGKLPILIKGVLQLKNIEFDASISSQFLTGFLMSYSYSVNKFYTDEDKIILVKNLNSKPYIDITLDVLEAFKLPVPKNNFYKEFIFEKNKKVKDNTETICYNIEGDWSGAAFMLVAGAISGKIILKNLNINSKQADRKIIDVLQSCGCEIIVTENEITVTKNKLNCFEFDATNCPDLFPPLVALAANCKGNSTIKGVGRLKHKESDRAIVLQKEFKKLGVEILLQNDEMIIIGTNKINGGIVDSNNDHRIAMACAIAALNANDKVVIENADAVNKSYPNFYKDLEIVGVGIK